MKLYCDDKRINLYIYDNEQISMLMVGKSRMGKTYFASCLGSELIHQGECVHLIDLGGKWSNADQTRLRLAGAVRKQVERERMVLIFNSVKEACGCGRIISDALGFRSAKAAMILKRSINQLFTLHGQQFTIGDLVEYLGNVDEEFSDDREWRMKLWEQMDSCIEMPNIIFCLEESKDFSMGSVIWDLSGLDDTYVKIAVYLINFCLLCQQKRKFRNGDTVRKTFVIIDEFQVLDCGRRSIIGICLTEGQKYGMALILITQFLHGNFPEAVVTQLKQGGFRFYFRLTEEEATTVSKALAGNYREREALYRKLVSLPRGNCLMVGPHYIKNSDDVTESFRFVEIKCD